MLASENLEINEIEDSPSATTASLKVDAKLTSELALLDSSAKTALLDQKKKQPSNREDILPIIKNINNNDHLLAFYLKYNRMFGKGEISGLIQQLDDNLQNQDKIKTRQLDSFKRRREKLKKLNKNIEPTYNVVYLSKSEILRHAGFRHLLSKVQYKIDKTLSPRAAVHLLYRVMLFSRHLPLDLIKTFRKKFEPQMKNLDILALTLYLTIICNYESYGIDAREARAAMYTVLNTLAEKDFEEANHVTVLSLARISLMSKQRVVRHVDLMQKLEPFVLKYISLYTFR
jgi:hypothetical protein